ncbi:MAG: FAD-binding oxidoreductase [Marinagarivorans sp.]|nr:FAD-binding oxidoreductase [Marinagarivorans sp.]
MAKFFLLAVMALSLNCQAQNSVKLQPALLPFTTDGCSMFPDGSLADQQLWLSCCADHDKAYWQGGSFSDRVAADDRLSECVNHRGEPLVAVIMLLGVRVGGSPFLPTQFRWGYGWRDWRGYSPLTSEEKALIHAELKTE